MNDACEELQEVPCCCDTKERQWAWCHGGGKAKRGVTLQSMGGHVNCSKRLKLDSTGQGFLKSDLQGPVPSSLSFKMCK